MFRGEAVRARCDILSGCYDKHAYSTARVCSNGSWLFRLRNGWYLKVETALAGQGDDRSCSKDVRRVVKVTDIREEPGIKVFCHELFLKAKNKRLCSTR